MHVTNSLASIVTLADWMFAHPFVDGAFPITVKFGRATCQLIREARRTVRVCARFTGLPIPCPPTPVELAPILGARVVPGKVILTIPFVFVVVIGET
jgi:hypothetical protein